MNFNIQDLLDKEEEWCQYMGYKNVYLDPFENHITDSAVVGDGTAYAMFPANRHVYDKLWVAKTQKLRCGRLEDLIGRENKIKYPIFIKPRWGHLSAASKNCFKINSANELAKYRDYTHMMWSDFVDGTEGMTDFILLNGRIVYQLTYSYSEKQHGFTDAWKYVSPDTSAPDEIVGWVNANIKNHTGFVNVQYRNDKIIEVGLRPARSGAYIIATDNYGLIQNIHNVIDKQYWDYSLKDNMHFKPFYVYKCYTKCPIIYLWPQKLLDLIVHSYTDMPLYEYYFEPVNNEGCVFMQFMHYDFEKGLKAKKQIEWLFMMTQVLFFIAFIVAISLIFTLKGPSRYILLTLVILMYMTRLLNPFHANYNWFKAYRQMFSDNSYMTTPEEFDKTMREIQN
uniref:ATP-grasp domain-containing protein n=1 Tax=viral metagenome TaxID=1070528 RepID=A0A6C0CS13_9ZZZZ